MIVKVNKIDEEKLNESFKILDPFADFITFDRDFRDKYLKGEKQKLEIYSALCYIFGYFFNYLVVESESNSLQNVVADGTRCLRNSPKTNASDELKQNKAM